MRNITYPDLVLAVAPTPRGFAFVLFEGPLAPFDWGRVKITAKPKNARILRRVERVIRRYHPDVRVLENIKGDPKRPKRAQALALALVHLAETNGVNVVHFDRAAIRLCFSGFGAKTKPEIAHAIAAQIPAFKPMLPPIRKLWMSEDERQSLFDAAALGLTYFHRITTDANCKYGR